MYKKYTRKEGMHKDGVAEERKERIWEGSKRGVE
jgi:hypothetical protein